MVEAVEIDCPECGSPMKLRHSRFGKFYGCSRYPECKGSHGAHPNGEPLGTPATQEVKLARMRAHEVFDTLWTSRKMTRVEAYAWMAKTLGLTKGQAHIGRFDAEMCERLILAVEEYLGS